MIIAYYPGAGGNRYLQRLLGNSWDKFNMSYDNTNQDQLFQHRYLLDTVLSSPLDHTLTHCMNSQQIAGVFPGQAITFIKSNLQASLRREWILHGHKRFVDLQIQKNVSRLLHYQAIKDPAWPEIICTEQLNQLPAHILKEVQADYSKVIDQNIDVPALLESMAREWLDKINSAYEIICWHNQYYNTYPVDFSTAHQVVDIDNDDDEFSQLMRKELSLYQSEIFDQVWKVVNE